ncbi:LPD7 domain-containing protein [Paucibacter sp. DJ2R-2]|uniref:LPD7 domain-containing protein n=1 Tax=Paucibacter sp. DJ2R-2 TaxID=2893558 RepID=UPI0021E4B6C0|nr:LPD7 domain-containing protein [Paucibacter sp. DJ2R-2]MCV2438575.1 hypothetical protein [Paucibacter sp. DJ2R-2]
MAQIEAALEERYVIKRSPLSLGPLSIGHTEYRFKGDGARVAFIESTVRLATETNNPSVARSMVDVAEARNWKGLRISGHEDFKRMVWLEASMRRIKTVGYEPQASDLELLQREKVARMSNRIEHAKETPESASQAAAPKTSARGNGGRKAVLTAIEAVLIAKQVPDGMRVAVMAAATDQLMQRIQTGRSPKVKVYDITAPSRARTHNPPPEPQRARDREGLTHAR